MAASRGWYFLLFTVSGFAGLIYESIWSHYLKLFLGHAAFAQALVLGLFMGGMALGAWLCSRAGARWRNLLRAYALVEAAIGVCAIGFHPLFQSVTAAAYDSIIPALGSPGAVLAFKWTLASALILPQSVLLGMTFPLMAGGLLRAHPGRQGQSLALLYFTNSLGAAAGVLASGFFLIRWAGLPGAMLTAGILNLVVALVVWVLARPAVVPAAPREASVPGARRPAGHAGLLVVALLTGAASFMYEIAWIRMLSMVLGASTHAFELMLSAFILGLAFGGLWMHRRIDRIRSPEAFLGGMQVAMGLLAAATLAVYGWTFSLMNDLIQAAARTDLGYGLFNVGSSLLALLVMFPAAFCAGTTLPLITSSLLRRGAGERSVGEVYAANTIGAISGVSLAIALLPLAGLKGVVLLGAAIDILLGLALLRGHAAARPAAAVALAASLAFASIAAFSRLDSLLMASGVFRGTGLPQPGRAEVAFHRDGRTATIHLLLSEGRLSIVTNGKSDALIAVGANQPPTVDESAMIMTGALPVAVHPRARTAAVIGMGSGVSTHALLASPLLERVDTIEIEPAIVEASRAFGERNRRAFEDPRSHIRIDDAKSHFSATGARYDIVTSMPSNPWVSGVAGLFTREFYASVRRHLHDDGVLVQWLQLYETDPALVASVILALAAEFDHYDLYASDDHNLLIVARAGRPPEAASEAAFTPAFAAEVARIGIRSAADFDLFRLGGRAELHPYFEQFAMPANSDYFPVLDQNAARARFKGLSAEGIVQLGSLPIPLAELLGGRVARPSDMASQAAYSRSAWAAAARAGRRYLEGGNPADLAALPAELRSEFELVRLSFIECRAGRRPVRQESIEAIGNAMLPFLSKDEAAPLWARLLSSGCAITGRRERAWLELQAAIAARDAPALAQRAGALLAAGDPNVDYVLGAAVAGHLAQGRRPEALELWRLYSVRAVSRQGNLLPELLRGHLFHAESNVAVRAGR